MCVCLYSVKTGGFVQEGFVQGNYAALPSSLPTALSLLSEALPPSSHSVCRRELHYWTHLQGGMYRPRTKETREAYEALLAIIHSLFGEQPQVG